MVSWLLSSQHLLLSSQHLLSLLILVSLFWHFNTALSSSSLYNI